MSEKHTIMYSGGLDSFLVLQFLTQNQEVKDNLDLLYFDLGAVCNSSEIELFNSDSFKKYVKKPVFVSSALNMGSMETPSAYIPNRNILAAIMTHSVKGSDRIWIGGTRSDRVNDNNPEVFQKLSELMTQMHDKEIVITSPFFNVHKSTMVREYVNTNGFGHCENRFDAQRSLVESTFSCYNPIMVKTNVDVIIDGQKSDPIETKECLECPACFRKCMCLYAGGIYIKMNCCCNKVYEMINHYYKEAVENINDEFMHDRYEDTIAYCERLNLDYENNLLEDLS